jgi:hypothetical protein
MTYGFIYKIEFPNGKHYIGQTISLKQRQGAHKCAAKSGDTKCLYNALRKYNMEDTFELIEIDTADTPEELCEKEIQYIQEYNSYYKDENGYNMTFGGDGITGHVHTEESKQKQSETMKKLYEDNPEARQKMSEAQKKYHEKNPEAAKEQGERLKEYYEKNPEARQRASEITKTYNKNNPEAGKEHSEAMKTYHKKNPNARQQASERTKKHYEKNPEARQQASERTKKQFESPQARRHLADIKGCNKPFDIFTTDGIFIKTFTYQFEAMEYLQKEHHITSSIKIGAVLSGQLKTSAGFVFKYK